MMKPNNATCQAKKSFWFGPVLLPGLFLLALVVLCVWWLSRGDWVYPEQIQVAGLAKGELLGHTTVGQTFVASQAGLKGIEVKVGTFGRRNTQPLLLHLRADPTATTDLRLITLSATTLAGGDWARFEFDPLPDSRLAYYYFFLESPTSTPGDAITLYYGPGEAYLDGASYLDGQPQEEQLVFRLLYSRPMMLLNFVERAVAGLPAVAGVLVLLLLPGAALLVWLRVEPPLEPTEWLAVAVGLSLSLYPLLLLLLRYTPVTLSAPLVWAGLGAAGLLLLVGLRRLSLPPTFGLKSVAVYLQEPAHLAFWLILGLSAGVRFFVIEGLPAPLWGDSYHHTVLTQLIVENGRLGWSWMPYAPYHGLNYHFGFHAMAALFHWLTGVGVIESVLIFGQILNTLAVLMAYVMGQRFGENAWVGVFAALLTGLIFKYPMFYVNWGRYTQLAGQLLLPPLILLVWLLLHQPERRRPLMVLSLLLVGGLFLTHYRVFLFYACFVPVAFLFRRFLPGGASPQPPGSRQFIVEDLIRLLLVNLGGLLLVSPRIGELVGSALWHVGVSVTKRSMEHDTFIVNTYNAGMNLFDYLPAWVVVLGWLGLAAGSWQRRAGVFVMGLWWLLLLLATNPHFLGLPGAGIISNFALGIGAYLFFAVFAGFILGEAVQRLISIKAALGWGVLLLLLPVVGGATWQQRTHLEMSGALLTRPDLRAAAWIKTHTPEDARFLINSGLAYNNTIVAGSDAGWWLPLLAGRQNTAPPMGAMMDTPLQADYNETLLTIYHDTREPGLSPAALKERMLAHQLHYVYIGQQRGRVWDEGTRQPLDPAWFAASPAFKLIYAQDRVRIFQVITAEAGQE